jgi:hypothetical protein
MRYILGLLVASVGIPAFEAMHVGQEIEVIIASRTQPVQHSKKDEGGAGIGETQGTVDSCLAGGILDTTDRLCFRNISSKLMADNCSPRNHSTFLEPGD